MKCISCQIEIPPTWSHSIVQNICAACGGPILQNETKELIDELGAALAEMKNANANQIVSWLLDNYELKKHGSAKPVNFYHKNEEKPSNISNVVNKIKNSGLSFDKNPNASFKDVSQQIIEGSVGQISTISEADFDKMIDSAYNKEIPMTVLDPNAKPLAKEDMKELISAVTAPTDFDIKNDERIQAERLEKLKRQELAMSGMSGNKNAFRRG